MARILKMPALKIQMRRKGYILKLHQGSRYCEGRYRNRYDRYSMPFPQGTFHTRETLLGLQIYPESISHTWARGRRSM